jgi:hypothetical protein
MTKRTHTAIFSIHYVNMTMMQVSLSDVEDLKRRPTGAGASQARHIISPDTDERGAEPTFIGTHLLLLVPVFMRIH